MLDRHTIDGQELWHIGFRPDEEVAWGMRREAGSGRWIVDRDPTISHVMDAVPGRQPFSDTIRNGLGQIIGKRAAEAGAAPIESMEAFLDTTRDVVTGRRLVLNMERRFEKSMFEQAGIPKPIIKDIFEKAREVAGLDHTTLRGLASGENSNLWKAIKDTIPSNVKLASGHTLDVHTVMDHLLTAAEGDMRIMGVTSVLTQRMRNTLRRIGLDPMNWSGQMTVTMYNKLRYSQPTFLIQRVTDAPYYGMLYGVHPLGGGALKGTLAELRAIEENMARTGVARDFSIDMPEYATRANFTDGVRTRLSNMIPQSKRLQKIIDAPDDIIANNMTAQLHSRLGTIVRGTLDDVEQIVKDAPPELQAEMRAELAGPMSRVFEDWRATYSQAAGRTLDDNEVGLKYLQEMLNSARRVRPEAAQVNLEQLIHEGERSLPSSIGEIGPIRPDDLAVRLGYDNAAAMRKDMMGTYQKVGGQFVHVPGEKDITWLQEHLAEDLNAHPDYAKRASAYFGDTWEGYWSRLAMPVESGGLDISTHYAREAQDLISRWAADRGMDPWEYLSGVMATNIGGADLDTTIGQLMGFLKAGASSQPMEAWTKVFRSTLDVSAQKTLLEEFETATGVRAPGAVGRDVPSGFTTNPHAAASGTTSTLPRDGLFHVTTAKDKVLAEGFKTGGSIEGFGSKGDVSNAGRISILTNRARATAYLDRITLAGKAARGESDRGAVIGYFKPLYEKAYGAQAAERMSAAAGDVVFQTAGTPQDLYQMVRNLDGGLIGGNLDDAERAVKLTAPFKSAQGWDPAQIDMLELASKERAGVNQGLDTGELTLAPEDLHVMGSASSDPFDAMFEQHFPEMVRQRILDGTPHPSPEVEGYIQQFSKWVQTSLKDELGARTRSDLRHLVESVPTKDATPFNRSHALVVGLLKDKINDAQTDIFRLAEMATQRSVLERSLNHPLFGLYPASYMWGKVLPETVKFLAKNPYAATYTIANVQRSIATQREYDPELDDVMGKTDRSSSAFLMDYLTPGLPWSDHAARMSPMVRDLFAGKDIGTIWSDELATVNPERWVRLFADSASEAAGLPAALDEQQPATPTGLESLGNLPSSGGSAEPPQPFDTSNPTKGTGLEPLLAEDMIRLQEVLLGG
jgi:hypothetical protein